MAQPKVSVVIPTMNEEKAIGAVMDAVHSALKPTGIAYEVLIVDTNSKDRTREIAKSKGAIVIDEPRRGYGRAYKTGFEKASGEFVATLDADCTYPAEDIPKFLAMLEKDRLDFITGDRISRMKRGVMSAKHKFGNWVLTKTSNLLYGTNIKDSQSGMWVFRRSIIPKLDVVSDRMALSEEIKIEVRIKGLRMREVPIEYRPREGEVKLNTWRDGIGNLRYMWAKKLGRAKP
ncbi:MAG: glycosyltransferase family 2 protein [Euryarchaeota archaeon]|nr:glycosyltransferase family 2 protein [Euryarchaeota archaeon]